MNIKHIANRQAEETKAQTNSAHSVPNSSTMASYDNENRRIEIVFIDYAFFVLRNHLFGILFFHLTISSIGDPKYFIYRFLN